MKRLANIKLLFILTPFVLLAAGERHDYHVSDSEWHWRGENQSWEVSIHLFSDDLERSLREKYNFGLLDIGGSTEHGSLDSLIAIYLKSQISVEQVGAEPELHYLGYESDIESTYAFFEILGVTPDSLMFVTNRVIADTYSDQKNVSHLYYNGARTTFYQYDMDWTSTYRW